MAENKPIRVLQLFTILNRGGAETMIMNYYRHINRNKIQFDFVVHREEIGAFEEEILSLGGMIYRFLPFHPKNFIAYQKQVSLFFDLHGEYNIIHGHCSELGFFFYKEAYKRGVKVIIGHAHNPKADFDSKYVFRFMFKLLSRKYLTHHFACEEESAKWLFGNHPNKPILLMKNAIDIKRFAYDESIATKHKKNAGLSDKWVIGHIGRFVQQKNHSFLIDVFYEVCKLDDKCVLVLVGDGPLRIDIEKKVKKMHLDNRVYFAGIRDDIPNYIQLFDLFLFPSIYEGLGVVVLEAQAAGLNCIVSDNVPQAVKIVSNSVQFVSLKKSSVDWANIVIKAKSYERDISKRMELLDSSYDIMKNVLWLESFYLNEND